MKTCHSAFIATDVMLWFPWRRDLLFGLKFGQMAKNGITYSYNLTKNLLFKESYKLRMFHPSLPVHMRKRPLGTKSSGNVRNGSTIEKTADGHCQVPIIRIKVSNFKSLCVRCTISIAT